MFFLSIHNEWQGDDEIPAETICNSTGWGLTSGGGLFPPNALQWVQIPVHSHEKCQETFTGIEITQGMICAGGPGASACNVSIVNKQLTKVLRAKSCNTNIPIPILFCYYLFFSKGDSGGPLVCPDVTGNGKLAGIVSFGHQGCTDATVYTKVSHYEDWIAERLVQ